ncbi:MAG: hypothetical protein U1F36_16140 [Planctomycetota bacterium]
MARRFALLIALLLFATLGLWTTGILGPAHPPAGPLQSDAQAARRAADERTADRVTSGEARAAESGAAVTAPESRVAIERGRGRLRLVPVFAGVPIESLPIALGLIAEETDSATASLTNLATVGGEQAIELELAAGSYRAYVVRGPGDAVDAQRSRYWHVDMFDDLVQVAAGTTTDHDARIVRTDEEVPPRGTAQIRGVAFLDGRPAAGCLVSSDPISGSRAARVAPDGSFDLTTVQGGLQRLQLSTPIELVRQTDIVTRIAAIDVAPRDGETLQVRIEALSSRLEVETVDPHGRPVAATVGIGGVPSCILPGIGSTEIRQVLRSGGDGRLTISPLPTCTAHIDATADGLAAAEITVELRAGVAHPLRVQLQPQVVVEGVLALDTPTTKRSRFSATIFFFGPRRAAVPVFDQGRFTCNELIPGRYRTRIVTTRMQRWDGPELEVGPAGLRDIRIEPPAEKSR